jgi:hypothetical protein
MKVLRAGLLLVTALLSVEGDPQRGDYPGQPPDNYEGCGQELTARKRIKGGLNITVSINMFPSHIYHFHPTL